jgi:hypothetical protein
MKYQFNLLSVTRNNIKMLVNALTLAQLNSKPSGFNNTIVWQLGHILVTQQLLCYAFSNQKLMLTDAIIEKYRKGSVATLVTQKEIDELLILLDKTSKQLEKDYSSNLFKTYTKYETSYGITLNTIEEAIQMNNVHEGVHFGNMLALKKIV